MGNQLASYRLVNTRLITIYIINIKRAITTYMYLTYSPIKQLCVYATSYLLKTYVSYKLSTQGLYLSCKLLT